MSVAIIENRRIVAEDIMLPARRVRNRWRALPRHGTRLVRPHVRPHVRHVVVIVRRAVAAAEVEVEAAVADVGEMCA